MHRVHALFRDPLRGGRGDFTEIKFDQIRSRCDKFGDFLRKCYVLRDFQGSVCPAVVNFFFEFFFEFFLNLYIFFEFLNFFLKNSKNVCMRDDEKSTIGVVR